jgi:hypothetical protein
MLRRVFKLSLINLELRFVKVAGCNVIQFEEKYWAPIYGERHVTPHRSVLEAFNVSL